LRCPETNKYRYADDLTARAVGSSYEAAQRAAGLVLYVYRCPHCGGWHLTRNDNGKRARVSAYLEQEN
jgi:hypothetical protein